MNKNSMFRHTLSVPYIRIKRDPALKPLHYTNMIMLAYCLYCSMVSGGKDSCWGSLCNGSFFSFSSAVVHPGGCREWKSTSEHAVAIPADGPGKAGGGMHCHTVFSHCSLTLDSRDTPGAAPGFFGLPCTCNCRSTLNYAVQTVFQQFRVPRFVSVFSAF